MKKKNTMNTWSIGLGSTLLMLMLAGGQDAVKGQAAHVDPPEKAAPGPGIYMTAKEKAAVARAENDEGSGQMLAQLLTLFS